MYFSDISLAKKNKVIVFIFILYTKAVVRLQSVATPISSIYWSHIIYHVMSSSDEYPRFIPNTQVLNFLSKIFILDIYYYIKLII